VKNYDILRGLPNSLHTEICLHLNQGLIAKVNLFNFSSPDFIIAITKRLTPIICMPGDYICRMGEIATEMYFIQQGEVEVIATDEKTTIAFLREGGYFGEIGLILTQKRTVYVKATTLCILQVLKKEDFDDVTHIFKSEYNYLKKVATQRAKVCDPEDIDEKMKNKNRKRAFSKSKFSNLNRLLTKSSFGKKLENLSEATIKKGLNPRARKPARKSTIKKYISDYISSGSHLNLKKKDEQQSYIILPMSKFYKHWLAIQNIAVAYNLIYVPYAISFHFDAQTSNLLALDLIALAIYFLDMVIQSNTARVKGYISDIVNIILIVMRLLQIKRLFEVNIL